MAPRHAVHIALAKPYIYLAGTPTLGMDAGLEDACIAYQLFLEVCCADLHLPPFGHVPSVAI